MVATFNQIEDIGEYVQQSRYVLIADPYLIRESCGVPLQAKPGSWKAGVIRQGEFVAALFAWHDSVLRPEIYRRTNWKRVPFKHDGQSGGVAGFFDEAHYRDDTIAEAFEFEGLLDDPDDPWYSMCYEVVVRPESAGVLTHGCACLTGRGPDDGAMRYQANAGGEAVALALDFMNVFEEELFCPKCGGSEYTCGCAVEEN